MFSDTKFVYSVDSPLHAPVKNEQNEQKIILLWEVIYLTNTI